ncbi:MAG TPA: TonB-dependent receptor, partial [Flavobacteriales bacterium]|nr:TonB-dependent receptor [Flavobacteriales bacterium]
DVIYVNHQNTDIAFSPWLVAGSEIGYSSKVGVRVALRTKIVGKQYLDNTSNDARAIDPYWTNDVVLSYSIPSNHWKDLELSVMVNNILDHQYVSNGYTYGYIYGDLITENFYYPQAGVNWMASVKWRF